MVFPDGESRICFHLLFFLALLPGTFSETLHLQVAARWGQKGVEGGKEPGRGRQVAWNNRARRRVPKIGESIKDWLGNPSVVRRVGRGGQNAPATLDDTADCVCMSLRVGGSERRGARGETLRGSSPGYGRLPATTWEERSTAACMYQMAGNYWLEEVKGKASGVVGDE
jgi:hypothetical protein